MSSIIIACEFESGVIIGADSQKVMGEYISNRAAKKLVKIDDRIYCSGIGSEANIQSTIDQVIYQLHAHNLNAGEASVMETASLFRDLCYFNRNTMNADFVIAGWDTVNGGQVYSISSGGVLKRESVCTMGSGSLYVYGYIDDRYTPNMGKDEAEEFVFKTIQLATLRDNMSGGYINLTVITNDGVHINIP